MQLILSHPSSIYMYVTAKGPSRHRLCVTICWFPTDSKTDVYAPDSSRFKSTIVKPA